MPLLDRPLTDTVAKPLRAALVWGGLVGGAGLAVALGVGGIGYAVGWVGSQFGDITPTWPGAVVRATLAAVAVASLGASAWAAAFTSTQRAMARTVIATLLGGIVLVAGIGTSAPASLLAAAAISWSVAVPFERWSRLVARVGVAVIVASVAWALGADTRPVTVATIATSYPLAAALIGVGDRAWRELAWRRAPDGDT
jgi:hypothetical protein